MSAFKIQTALSQLEDDIGSFEQELMSLIQEKKKMPQPLQAPVQTATQVNHQLKRVPIAIIGMGAIFPKARTLQEYWTNILQKVDCITDVPASRWNVEDFYDPDPSAPDKTYCRKGGFIPDIKFNPLEFGLPPNILEITDISQLLGLVVAKETLVDAGYDGSREFDRDRTGVILGIALARQLAFPLSTRLEYPVWEKVLRKSGLSAVDTEKIIEKLKLAYIGWSENSFPGALANVVAGRIANRFNLGGTNCVVDAACASSFGALKMAISELTEYRADMMLTGGVDTDNTSLAYLCFSKTPALSRKQRIAPFSADADGMMLGEGVGMMLLKRLEDAERDHDRIYAVIRGVGTSSDGRSKSIYAPRAVGQVKALQRAYEDADLSPASVGLIEAHGTGTIAGDRAEFSALKDVFEQDNPQKQSVGLGSIKSQIGHTKAAAGAASLIKAALALHHKILPPTINVDQPNPRLNIADSVFYLNTDARPWLHTQETPRRAGVSSFGFGGTNFHVILEEYQREQQQAYRLHKTPQAILIYAATPDQLLQKCRDTLLALHQRGEQSYAELMSQSKTVNIPGDAARIGFVASSSAEACRLLETGIKLLQDGAEAWNSPEGIYYRSTGLELAGKVVALFPGQGSQYLNMGRELVMNFPVFRQLYAQVDQLMRQSNLPPISDIVFPPPTFDPSQQEIYGKRLQQTEFAQPAIAISSVGLYKLMQQAGFQPDFVAGHSFGELTALWSAGVMSDQEYFALAQSRGQAMASVAEAGADPGAMLAVKGANPQLKSILKEFPQIQIANVNSNRQIVLAGPTAAITQVQQVLNDQQISTVLLPVSAAFHTPLVKSALKGFSEAIKQVKLKPPKLPVYTNVTGEPYSPKPDAIRRTLETHLSHAVLFRQEIENIYAAGGFCFVEFGPQSILTNLVKDTLGERPHIALALNASRLKDSDRQLRDAIVQLRVSGMTLTDPDCYQLAQPISAPSQPEDEELCVCLTGANYVSEKTKQAFEQALNDGYVITVNTEKADSHLASELHLVPNHTHEHSNGNGSRQNGANGRSHGNDHNDYASHNGSNGHNGNGNHNGRNGSSNGGNCIHVNQGACVGYNAIGNNNYIAAKTHNDTIHNGNQIGKEHSESHSGNGYTPAPALSMRNHQQIFESLRHTIRQSRQLQQETIQAHTEFLQHQTNYTEAVLHLTQQQKELLTNAAFRQQQPQTQLNIWEEFHHSNVELHEHQAETLQIHQQYLNYQFINSQALLDLLQEQYTGLSAENLNSHSSRAETKHTELHAEAVPLHASAVAQNSIQTGSPQALPQNHSLITVVPTMAPVKIEPIKIEPAKAEAAKVEPAKVEPARIEPAITEPAKVEPVTAPAQLVATTPHPAEPPLPDAATLSQSLLRIISEKTGYPLGAMNLDMDIEADLGVDSIKRVEILGAIQDMYPNLPQVELETLAELRTFGQVIALLEHQIQAQLTDSSLDSALVTAQIAAPHDSTGVAVSLAAKAVYLEAAPTTLPKAPDEVELRQSLLRIISEKTGYPLGAMNLDMDIEADLGVDSIKRVEILGAIQDMYPNLPQVELETLAELRTFNEAIELLKQADPAPEGSTETEAVAIETCIESPIATLNNIQRRVVKLKSLPEPDRIERTLPQDSIVLLTDDGSPLTVKLAEALQAKDWKVVVLRFPSSLVKTRSSLPKAIDRITLSSLEEEHLRQQIQKIEQRYGAIAMLIHLAPAVDRSNGNSRSDKAAVLLQQVFLLAKHLQPSLTKAAQTGFAGFFTVMHLDGELGLAPEIEFHPVNAGLLGLTKSLQQEWDDVVCRAIDLSPKLSTEQMTTAVLAELHDPNKLLTEVGYGAQGRSTLSCELPNPQSDRPQPIINRASIGSHTVFLVSGGAKGITAQCVIKLAQTYRCQFILLGRSSLLPEPDWAKGYTGAALKQQIMQHLSSAGKTAMPVEIQTIFQQIEARREITATLQAIEQAGGRAEYISVDITDAEALQSKLKGKLDSVKAIIHGAGNLADKRIEKKTLQDFTTVFDTKVIGLKNLLQSVPINQLEHLVLFSSVAGVYGNVGQTDYAAANEVLNKMAHCIQQSQPSCHVVAMNWGPWDSGMVTSELKQLFAQRHIETISVEIGTQCLIEELSCQNAVQVVIGSPLSLPPQKLNPVLKTHQIHRRLAVINNPFLQDHMIHHHPVLPATCAMAWMANACEQLYPGYRFFSQTGFKVLKGIILDEAITDEYTLELEEIEKQAEVIKCIAKIRSNQNGRERYHFRAHLTLMQQRPAAPVHRSYNLSFGEPMLPDASIYSSTSGLFHGQSFQGIQRVLNFSSEHITVECALPNYGNQYYGQFSVQSLNPYVADVQLQPLLLWTQHFHQQGCLPSEAAEYEQFAEIEFDQPFYVSTQIVSKNRTAVVANVITHDGDGRVYSRMFGAKGVVLPLTKLLAASQDR